ncbi:hypothetical protein L211DRAFT_854637 [Terfezia boudieri ATCC MYA-4762]|uniref:Uncharacterized protein n=1 Tax=Terfezia boudieri ATCC MYA-4762 TaxID=1051890 RepID=A0A3N4L521_9PEZI|nr:hypothetical protein L211DRAFT_854637 [Terfezia boudieri ATCC MYA-4762]
MFVRKKAYILYKWYELSDEQKRFYLDLEEQEELPDFQIPKAELEVTQDNQTTVQPVPQFTVVISVVPINRQAYGRYDEPTERGLTELAEGGADDCLSNEDVGADIEEHKWEALESSLEEEEEVQLTESDSNERRTKKLVRAKIIEALLSSNTEDNDYRNSTEEDDGEVNE